MKRIILLFLIVVAGVAKGQSVKIYGQILDSLEGPIPGATVMLVGAQDSILKSFSVSDKDGLFTFSNIKAGEYVFKASFFGYDPYEQSLSIGKGSQDTSVGKIQLQSKMLNKVTVQGHYIPIQIKGDTIEYDSRAFETGEHDVVEDLLNQLPGIEVNEDGSIKAQGKDVDKILVDGEEFFADDPTLATKNLPAEAVDKVQVFDKQSDMAEFTGVDDGNESTTINLKLKDSHKKGMFGNLEAAGGTDAPIHQNESFNDYFRYTAKGNVHYFKKKWQLSFIGMSNNVNETGFSIRDYINFMGGISNMMRDGGMGFDLGSGIAINTGGANDGFLNTNATGFNFNYKPSKQTVLNASIFFNGFDKTYNKNLDRTTYFADSSLFTNERVNQRSTTMNNRGNLHFEQKIDSTHFINVDFSGNWNLADYYNVSLVNNFNPQNALTSDFSTDLNQENFSYDYTAAADYRKKFAKAGRYTGGGVSYDASNSDASTTLDYVNQLYFAGVSTAFNINQIQDMIETSGNLNANWMWSEPLTKKMLLQTQYNYVRRTSGRDKDVWDVVSDDQIPNDFFSAEADYLSFRHQAGLKHKYISKNFRTTIGATYQYVNLSGDSIFTAGPKEFHYVMPSVNIQWEPSKSSDMRINYSTSLTLPSLNQLQPLPDNSNPSEVVLGNTNLEPEYNHNLMFSFHKFDEFTFTHFMFRLSGAYVTNNITYSQNINEFLIREITPENLGDEKSLSSYLALGSSLHAIHIKFNVSNNSSLSNGLIMLNSVQDQYTSFATTPTLSIENINKKVLSVRGGFTYTWSQNSYQNNDFFNNTFSNYSYFGNLKLKLKDRWVLSSDINHYFYPDFEVNSQQVILDAKIGVNLTKSRKLQLYLAGYDLLNQNTGINQYYLQNIYEEETTSTLARYFMLGFKYSFQKLGASK
ncbi:MAG: TonB-dependent receptor [Flavobacteriales bacterium]|nr:TonB-dependent receptor [Flavobacteriales bacterium]